MMKETNRSWAATMMEVDGRLELVVIFEKEDTPTVVMRFSELEKLVTDVRNDIGPKGLVFLDEENEWN